MKHLLLIGILFIFGCAEHRDVGEIVNGYKLMAMNPQEVYVANQSNELIVGPVIKSIGLSGDMIIVYCGTENKTVNGFENTTGYNLIDTKSGIIKTRLSESEVSEVIRDAGLPFPKMESAQKYL